MAVRRALTSAFALLLALGPAVALPLAASADDTVAFTIEDPRITESSGLAADPRAGGYWTSNDSGDAGIAYRLDPSGDVTGTLTYRAQPVDVEAVAMHDGRLYLADIGDNAAERELVTVYSFGDARANDQTVPYRSWEFRYPDGAHDAETLLVDKTGRMYVVTKGAQGGIYRAPKVPKRTLVNELDRVGDAPAAVTDGTFLPDNDRIALLTLGTIQILDRDGYRKVAEVSIPAQEQAESLAVSLDGESLLVGSEGQPSKVYAVPIPEAGEGSSASPDPTASPSSDSDAGQPDPAEQAGSTGQGRARTLLALGLAGLVAIVAGSVVALVKRP